MLAIPEASLLRQRWRRGSCDRAPTKPTKRPIVVVAFGAPPPEILPGAIHPDPVAAVLIP